MRLSCDSASALRALAALVAALALLCETGAPARALSTTVLRPTCVVSGNTCTVRMPMTAADNNASVVITTPRANHGALITDNNHKPFNAMYYADETSKGMTFELQGVGRLVPGTVLIITFKLLPVGSKPASTTPTPSPSTSAGSAALSLIGPTSNKVGSSFAYKVSADAAAPALFIAAEVSGSSCAASASAYGASSERVHQSVRAGAINVTLHFVAEPAGTFALCVYLVNPTTHATEAHAGAHWTNGA